jgi:hypothetical protein
MTGECTFRGRENNKLQYAVLAAAALHGGAEPDLHDEAAWWQGDGLWRHAPCAAVAITPEPGPLSPRRFPASPGMT